MNLKKEKEMRILIAGATGHAVTLAALRDRFAVVIKSERELND